MMARSVCLLFVAGTLWPLLGACSEEADSGSAATPPASGGAAGTDDEDGTAAAAGASGGDQGASTGSGGMSSQPSGGCGVPWTAPDAELEEGRRGAQPMLVARRSIEIAGVERNYLLTVPPDYDPERAYPLVFGFHGSGGDREQLRRYMNVEGPAAGQAIFVYPEGLDVNDRGTGWNLGSDSDDLAFVDALLAKYTSELCIDERAVFATGHSFGGCMSNTVGCYRGEAFRAIAPVAGCTGGGRNVTCTGKVAALLVHSPKDTSTNYEGAIRACTRYLRANSCDEMPECGCHHVAALPEGAEACVQEAQEPYETEVDLSATERDDEPPIARSYLNCDPGYPVAFVDHWRREREEIDDPSERWHNPPPWTGALVWEFFATLPPAELE